MTKNLIAIEYKVLVDKEDILEKASKAFWDSVASHFPKGTSGDMSPYDTHVIEKAMEKAIDVWIYNNYPSIDI